MLFIKLDRKPELHIVAHSFFIFVFFFNRKFVLSRKLFTTSTTPLGEENKCVRIKRNHWVPSQGCMSDELSLGCFDQSNLGLIGVK